MNHDTDPLTLIQETAEEEQKAGWSDWDTWIGLGIAILMILSSAGLAFKFPTVAGSYIFIVLYEFLLLIPIAIIFLWRRVAWKDLGFRSFQWSEISFGCGYLILAYGIILIHNYILVLFGVSTQGDMINEVFSRFESPLLFMFVGVILAPLLEEMFFRGFLFKGFRQKYGWKAALFLSSFIFALSHLQLSALVPTFMLGCVLTYMYHRTNSLYPGMIIHFMINAWGLLAGYIFYKFGAV